MDAEQRVRVLEARVRELEAEREQRHVAELAQTADADMRAMDADPDPHFACGVCLRALQAENRALKDNVARLQTRIMRVDPAFTTYRADMARLNAAIARTAAELRACKEDAYEAINGRLDHLHLQANTLDTRLRDLLRFG